MKELTRLELGYKSDNNYISKIYKNCKHINFIHTYIDELNVENLIELIQPELI